MKLSRKLAAVLVSAGAAVSGVQAQEYYRQSPVDGVGGYSSQDARNPGGLGWFSEVADNFPGQTGWSINHLEFWGGYVSGPNSPGHTQGFTIRFYTDNGGHPGTRVYEHDVPMFTETQYYLVPPIPPNFPDGIAGYHYELSLPTPFVVSADGQYWLSVVAILDRGGSADEPQWGWVQAQSTVAPSAHQWFFMPGNFQPTGVDVSFVLANAGSPCRVDIDHNGVVNVQDFLGFLQAYSTADAVADFNGDGSVNIQDFLAFLQAYAAGC